MQSYLNHLRLLTKRLEEMELTTQSFNTFQSLYVEGSIFPRQPHDQHETLIILSGEFEVHKGGEVINLVAGQSCYFRPHEVSTIHVREDGWIIGILVSEEESED